MGSFVSTPGAWALATVVSTIGIGMSVYNIVGHINHYTAPTLQKDVVRLLFIVPLYGVCSILSLIFLEASPYLEIVRDIYEAFVIYCFLNLMLAFGGGEHHMTVELMDYPPMKHPPPLCCLPPIVLNTAFVKGVKKGTLQFVVVKLVMATISIALLAAGLYDDPGYEITNLVIYNISYTIALYALLLFYMATRNIVSTMSPAKKFFAIKTIVFFTYWQELLVSLGPSSTEEANRWNDFILCLEMPLFAYVQYRAFPWHEFQTGVPDRSWLEAAGEVMSVRDVAQDIYHNVKPAYQEYTLNSQSTGVVDQQGRLVGTTKKKYKTRTFILGNLGMDTKKHGNEGVERKNGALGPPSVSESPTSKNRGIERRQSKLRMKGKDGLHRPLTEMSVVEVEDAPSASIGSGEDYKPPEEPVLLDLPGEDADDNFDAKVGQEDVALHDESMETLGLEHMPVAFPSEGGTSV